MEARDERAYEAEIHRLKGELLLCGRRRNESEAEACFQAGLEAARRHGAKALELRTALSLSALWKERGKPEEARTLLQTAYDGFTEGFETADLVEAKAILETLAESGTRP